MTELEVDLMIFVDSDKIGKNQCQFSWRDREAGQLYKMVCRRNCFERLAFSFLKEAVITMDNKYRVDAVSVEKQF